MQEQDDRQGLCQVGGTVISRYHRSVLGFITHTKRHKSQESQERSPDLERVGATQLVLFSISPCFHIIVCRMTNRIVQN